MNEPKTHIYEFGDFRIDVGRRLLLLRSDGESVPLTPKVFDTLLYLVEHSGAVLDKDALMAAIWPDIVVEENNLSQNIYTLRRVLGESRGEHRYIMTVPGRGYRFVADVKTLPGENGREEAEITESRVEKFEKSGAPPAEITKKGKNKIWLVAAGVFVAGLSFLGFYLWRAQTKPAPDAPIKTIAVMPFKPLVAENRNEALQLGMADTLIARLSNSEKIVVRPITSVRRYGGLEQDSLAAGRELGVDSVLDGSIQTWGDRIRISARLVSVGDGKQLWAGQFDEKFTDIFAVQDSISERVAAALVPRLSGEERRRLTKHDTENLEAYQLYLKGRFHAAKLTLPETKKAISYFQQAIEIDPTYALAYARLANAYRQLTLTSDVPSSEAMTKAKAAASDQT